MPRVLLVKDEPAIGDSLVDGLETEGFEVVHALTGADGLSAAGREAFDFAILDIGLPDMTGTTSAAACALSCRSRSCF